MAAQVRLALVQFSFTDRNIIPCDWEIEFARSSNSPPPKGGQLLWKYDIGKEIRQPDNFLSVNVFSDLKIANYKPVRVFAKERERDYIIRAEFVDESLLELSFQEEEEMCRKLLVVQDIYCTNLFVGGTAHENSYFEDGVEVHGQCALCLNVWGRQRIFQPNGEPEVMWRKDENKRRIGDAPIPLKAAKAARFRNGTIELEAL